jgi:hypothetical protein
MYFVVSYSYSYLSALPFTLLPSFTYYFDHDEYYTLLARSNKGRIRGISAGAALIAPVLFIDSDRIILSCQDQVYSGKMADAHDRHPGMAALIWAKHVIGSCPPEGGKYQSVVVLYWKRLEDCGRCHSLWANAVEHSPIINGAVWATGDLYLDILK